MGLQRVGHDLVTKQQQQYRMEVVDKKMKKKERKRGREKEMKRQRRQRPEGR